MTRFLLALCIALVCAPRTARAGGGRDGFFDKNYAHSPLQDEKVPVAGTSSRGAASSSPARAPSSGDSESDNGFDEVGSAASSSVPSGIVPEIDPADAKAIQILAIDGVISFMDPERSKEVVQSMIAMSHDHKLRFRRLYAFGDPSKTVTALPQNVRLEFLPISANIVQVDGVPKDLPIKGLPAWVFYTAQGRFIGEGMDALQRLTTTTGKLNWPDGQAVLAAASVRQGSSSSAAAGESPRERIDALVKTLQESSASRGKGRRK